jgi:hypothetical protein
VSDLYLGRTVAAAKPLLYPSRDLVTHGVCVGMTGSGKTGLCIGLLEELLLADVPLFLLDPKGDVTNLLLVFPDLRSEDFVPWVDPDSARRNGRSVEAEAAAQAALWKEGLAKWDVPPDSLRSLREKVSYRVFTPGSRSGTPVNLLGSFDPPAGLFWDREEEALRDEVRGQVTGLLALAGIGADPVQDPRHILLARVLEARWRDGQKTDLASLIALAESPPFERVGAMELEAFLPRAERRGLALALNNLLASPDFETWRSGDPLDPAALVRDASGRPSCNLFYLAHLDDRERMFFVSRFLERYWTWARTQTGTSDLRALLYFDEVMGYLPPVAEPPSKRALLTILKQGRAFGCGALLVTQNPVDLDYKALSNAGTWFVGRLQAERDKERLLDGLESAGIGMPRAEIDRTISGLEKRRFLFHDVHRSGGPVVFESRWARAYLRGPLALRQIADLARLTDAAKGDSRPAPSGVPVAAVGSPVPPSLDAIFRHRYAPAPVAAASATLSGEVVAHAEARVARQRPPVSGARQVLVRFGGGSFPEAKLDSNTRLEDWSATPPDGATFAPLPGWAEKANAALTLERLAKDSVAAEGFALEGAPKLGIVRNPEETDEAFGARLRKAVESEIERRSAKAKGPLSRRIESLERKIEAETRELARDKAEQTRAATYSAVDVGASVLGTILGGGRRSVGSAARAGGRGYARIQRAAEMVKESEAKIAAWSREREALAAERETELTSVRSDVEAAASRREEMRLPVSRADVRVLGWYVLWT